MLELWGRIQGCCEPCTMLLLVPWQGGGSLLHPPLSVLCVQLLTSATPSARGQEVKDSAPPQPSWSWAGGEQRPGAEAGSEKVLLWKMCWLHSQLLGVLLRRAVWAPRCCASLSPSWHEAGPAFMPGVRPCAQPAQGCSAGAMSRALSPSQDNLARRC